MRSNSKAAGIYTTLKTRGNLLLSMTQAGLSDLWLPLRVSGTSDIIPLVNANIVSVPSDIYDFNNANPVQYKTDPDGNYIIDPSKVFPGADPMLIQILYNQVSSLGANSVTNGGMELDTGWNNRGAPVTNERSSEQAYQGTYSRKIVVNAQYTGCVSDEDISLVAGNVYIASVYVYGDGVNKFTVRVAEKSAAPTDAHYPPIVNTLAGYIFPVGWTKVLWSFIPGLTEDYVFEFFSGTGVTAGTIYADNVSITEINGNHAIQTTQANQAKLWHETKGAGYYPAKVKYTGTQSYPVGDIGTIRSMIFSINPDTTTEALFQLSGTVSVSIVSGTLTLTGATGTIYVNGVAGSSVSAGVSSVIGIVFSAGITADTVIIGSGYNGLYGFISDYDEILTQSQIISFGKALEALWK